MLRVGLTGDLGSGKSTVAKILAEHGAVVLSSDEMGRAMMQPGEPVFDEIVAKFGSSVVSADGTLDRKELARLAFDVSHPRVDELNAIVHPAVIAEQARQMEEIAVRQPDAIVVVESALLFTTPYGDSDWRKRFDLVILVVATEENKIARFIERAAAGRELSAAERDALREDALRRLALQKANAEHEAECIVIPNNDSYAMLSSYVNIVYRTLEIGTRN